MDPHAIHYEDCQRISRGESNQRSDGPCGPGWRYWLLTDRADVVVAVVVVIEVAGDMTPPIMWRWGYVAQVAAFCATAVPSHSGRTAM